LLNAMLIDGGAIFCGQFGKGQDPRGFQRSRTFCLSGAYAVEPRWVTCGLNSMLSTDKLFITLCTGFSNALRVLYQQVLAELITVCQGTMITRLPHIPLPDCG